MTGSLSNRGEGGEGDLAPSLLQAALELASHGHPVLPLHTPTDGICSCGRDCGRVGKHPRGVYGLKHATTDPDWIDFWWGSQPRANIGLRCDGLVVLDVDSDDGVRSLATLEVELGPLPDTWQQSTGRGRHLIYAANVSGNSTTALGNPPGVDLRAGKAGYVVAAPSLHASGQRYQQHGPPLPVPLPPSWQERLSGGPAPTQSMSAAVIGDVTTAYGTVALEGELRAILSAPVGDRNNQLNRSAFRLAQLVAGGELARDEAWNAAYAYARRAGLWHDEVIATLRSAIKAGSRYPRRRQR